MGGFLLCDKNGQPTKILAFPDFRRLLNQGVIGFPRLTSSEIQQRSNFHPAIALIAFLQAAWFVTRCISRLISGSLTDPGTPVITQLEAMTASIVIGSWCTFFFAWQKPLDARSHILIMPIDNPSTDHDRYQRGALRTTVIKAFEWEESLSVSQGTERRIQLEFPESQSTSTSTSKFFTNFRITPCALISTVIWPIESIFTDLNELLPRNMKYSGPSEFPDGTLKVPLFYVQTTMQHRVLLVPVFAVGTGISILPLLLLRSGSILYLSSQAAQRAWRIASITSTSLTAVMLGFAIVTNVFYLLAFPLSPHDFMHGCLMGMSKSFQFMLLFNLLVCLIPLLVARLVLPVASVIGFMSTAGDVFWGRSWADYIPHFS